MGRWAQRQRRATPSESPPPAPLTVLFVEWDGVGEQYTIAWSGPIGYDSSGTLSNFTVDGTPYSIVAGDGSDFVTVSAPGGPGAGATWAIAAQPPELASPVAAPSSGTTT